MAEKARSPFPAVVKAALAEARRRGDRRLGTEHLFLGLLHDPASATARAVGVSLADARAAMDALDRAALLAIGIDVGAFPDDVPVPRRHPPVTMSAVTSSARATLDQAVRSTTRRTRATAPAHLLRALLDRRPPDPVAALISYLHIDPATVHTHIAPPTT
ncbi:hypothetical protein Ssi03_30620 [Sphaerisporangium siamense]|uniref:ATP-dependent Clp protease ATP-binding subunit ClpA n=1 Tax=Sphaerisporangium siamense TaxID=795645 RepID=A0A7W7GEQ4_9ACTN|nr:Clp protease N-terminal domain-containing protein [Sphaerisporangium siamense]MBB4704246.1 ATP-dependent Clp protease ATP-binding subunit ClpA [Sphaerisporangium siamense]GII85072.1 hypothetical protein Ssi03_30620 [Sphaerisporangium siamense]